MSVEFHDNSMQILANLRNGVDSFLEEAGAEVQSETVRNSRRASGKTAGSYTHKVTSKEGLSEVKVGSDYQNAIWEEFGTGEYALHGDGRKGGWVYQAPDGSWHRTKGKSPNRPLQRAFDVKKPLIEKNASTVIKSKLGG